jgi:5-methylcytosine-specific restriction endonuclease McrA
MNAQNQTVLVLNASFEPIQICSARRAFALIVKEKAVIQEHHDREAYVGIMYPSVLRLREFAKIPHRVHEPSRRNILLRDRHQCMYCAVRHRPDKLTLDHVIPKSRGGLKTWGNLVACCEKCNRFKADRTPEEAGMMLIRKPRPATIHTSRFILRSMGAEDAKWKKYLYYDSEGCRERVTLG